MITKVLIEDVFKTPYHHIAVAINIEGFNDTGFISNVFRGEKDTFFNTGKKKLGDILSIKLHERTFHGLVCYSLTHGWGDASQTITSCLEKIETDEPIAVILMSLKTIGMPYEGADVVANIKAIHKANKNVVLFNYYHGGRVVFDAINK